MEKQPPKRHMSKLGKYKQKLGKSVPVSKYMSLSVICPGTMGSSKCLVLHTAYDRYMFNCGENSLKNFSSFLTHAYAIQNIFFTYNSWSNLGGLLGGMMTISQQVMNDPVVLHGPPHVDKVMGMTQNFAQVEGAGGKDATFTTAYQHRGVEEGFFEDHQLVVQYVKLVPRAETSVQSIHGTEPTLVRSPLDATGDAVNQSEICDTLLDQSDNKEQTGDSKENIEAEEEPEEKFAVAYIVTPKACPRSFDDQKIKDLNLPKSKHKGDFFQAINNNKSVTLPDGRVVHPEDLYLPITPAANRPFIVLECPRQEFLDSLLASPELENLKNDPETMPKIIVHMSPSEVINDPRYTAFMDRYSEDVTHLMVNEHSEPGCATKCLMLQSALNHIHPQLFPLIHSNMSHEQPVLSTTGKMVQAMFGHTLHLRFREPVVEMHELRRLERESHIETARKKALVQDNDYVSLDQELEKMQENVARMRTSEGVGEDYPEIVFLGTGSAQPSIRRNASAILVQMRKDEYMLLDCGEGTLSQLYQIYGAEIHTVLTQIKAIFISHLHYDHHGGVFNIVEARYKALQALGREDEACHVIGPRRYKDWLKVYNSYLKEGGGEIKLHCTQDIADDSETEHTKSLKTFLGLEQLNCVFVTHTRHSFAVIMAHQDGWKLVYSGDTRPTSKLIPYGTDCDILIHEGSFNDRDEEDAKVKKHSTTGEAIDIGRQMGAKFILLTHFSQKMQYIPTFTHMFTENVGFSFDFMKVKRGQLREIPLLKPVLQKLFEDETQDEMKKKRKTNKSKRKGSPLENEMDDDLRQLKKKGSVPQT